MPSSWGCLPAPSARIRITNHYWQSHIQRYPNSLHKTMQIKNLGHALPLVRGHIENKQIQLIWKWGKYNWVDYFTKHCPLAYHRIIHNKYLLNSMTNSNPQSDHWSQGCVICLPTWYSIHDTNDFLISDIRLVTNQEGLKNGSFTNWIISQYRIAH